MGRNAPENPDVPHVPVLPQESLTLLEPQPGDTVLDGTLGCGGHSFLFAQAIGASGHLIGLDRDPDALAIARERLSQLPAKITLLHDNYSNMSAALLSIGISCVQRIFLDIGVSSLQLDRPERGFSFMEDGPLDMRMNPTQPPTAQDLVHTLPEEELARIIYEYGEERFSRRIAKRIAEARQHETINTTGRLAELVSDALGGRRGRVHPATRTFQALRIAVNDELGELERGLAAGLELLAPAGRMGIITFHSLEDRIVKLAFKDAAKAGRVRLVNKKVVKPAWNEPNRRARSAKLRVCEKL